MTRTNDGADFQCGVMGDTSSNGTGAYAAANYLGVTGDTASPVATDTTLASEVGSGTLIRVQATYAHTTGESSYTLTHLFTSDQTITLAKVGVFNAASDGILVFEDLLVEVAPLFSGDQVLIVESIDI